MEKTTKPENLYIKRNCALTAVAAVLWLAGGIGFAVITVLASLKSPLTEDIRIAFYVAAALFTFIMLICSALNFRNLFYPFIFTADENGVRDCSGFIHGGFVGWDEIDSLSNSNALNIIDALDGEMPSIRIYLKDIRAYRRKLNFLRKVAFFFECSQIRVRTLCSQVKRAELYKLLYERWEYYASVKEVES